MATILALLTILAGAGSNEPATKPADACNILPREEMRLRLTVTSPLVSNPSEIQRIVDHVWAAEGLRFRWAAPGQRLDSWNQLDAWILVGEGRVHASKPEAIGSVQFGTDGVPGRIIRLSAEAAQAWVVAAEARIANLGKEFIGMRSLVPLDKATRILGYAAAHEIGHFVLASKAHAGDGLMQAKYTDPFTVAGTGLRLDARSQHRLKNRLAAAALCR